MLALLLAAVAAAIVFPAAPELANQQLAIPWALVGIGAGMLYDHFKGKKEQQKVQAANAPLQAATAAEGVRAGQLETQAGASRADYQGRIEGFDPREYAREAAGADAANIFEGFQYDEGDRKRNIQQRGFGTGSPLGQFQNRERFNMRLANALAGRSMEAASMHGQNLDRFGDLSRFDAGRADLSRERELDLHVGNRDFAQGQANAGSQRRNQLLGLMAQGAGAYYGSRA